ncbi:MAG: family 20 glycosylhydrolase [Bifidobacterium sp.]|uniref:beta-N-acetylhexosaminidase n=1 Tax=Bifidobacterium fermentum TaxID=3059035 RepID=A0AB39UKM5_9BIFI
MTENLGAERCDRPSLIPQPRALRMIGGTVSLPISGTVSLCLTPKNEAVGGDGHRSQASSGGASGHVDSGDDRIIEKSDFLAEMLAQSMQQATGLQWNITRGERHDVDVLLEIDSGLDPHGYRLTVGKPEDDGGDKPAIDIAAYDLQALREGVQTLRQLVRQYGTAMPRMVIDDRPAYEVRSYSLDVTRGRVPTLEWLKTWIDKLSLYKYNQLQLYVEHSGKVRGLSESWRGTSPLTSRDFIELDGYCAMRGIELVASISTFGHHYMTLRTRSFRELGEFPEQSDRAYSFIERQEHHTMNINHPDAFKLSTHLIDSYLGNVSSRFFNIGGDETFDLGKGRSRQAEGNQDIAHMYASYVQRLCAYIEEHGHQAMLWGDIAVEMPQILDLLPDNVVILNWLYAPDITEDKVALVARSGARQYVCAAVHSWNSVLPHVEDGWNNISRLAKYGIKYHAEGFMVTDWGDYGHINDPRMSIPAMIYGAQESWNPGTVDVTTLDMDMSRLEYGDSSGRCVADMKEVCRGASFTWENIVHYLELDDGSGAVNDDVFRQVMEERGVPLDIDPSEGLAAVREEYVRTLSSAIAKCDESNALLQRAMPRLMARIAAGSIAPGNVMEPWLVASQGQQLFNRFGDALLNHRSASQRAALAEDLEVWFELYCEAWRSISRESELRRVADDIWKCADILRSADATEPRAES